jgi:uncharacterized protein
LKDGFGETMQIQLDYLVRLQHLDRAIEKVLFDTKENPNRLAQVDEETKTVEEGFNRFLSEMEALKKQRRDLEREVEELDQKIKKSQSKLMEVKTNKEYRAMLTEIDEQKKVKRTKEDLLLEFLEKLEEGQQKEKSLKKVVESKAAEGKVKKDTLEEDGKKYAEELSGLNQQRKDLTVLVEPSLLKQYEFLKNKLKGVGVSEARDAICLSCHMQIPPQLYNDLFRQDRIITCPSCLRILYLSETREKPEE